MRYWFRPKRYGYGATPVTWEGWALTIAVAATVMVSIVLMNRLVGRSDFAVWILWAAFIAVLTLSFVRVTRSRTDGEWRWRWGDQNNL